MADIGYATSRRSLLKTLMVAPIATLAESAVASPWDAAIAALPYHGELVVLRRMRAGRSDSRFRYHNAESFFFGVEKGLVRDERDRLYRIGIVLQLGLSSHLLDVGFGDQWCARHVGLNIARSLAYANAIGFGFELAEFDLLAAILSPYNKWRFRSGVTGPKTCLSRRSKSGCSPACCSIMCTT